MTDRYTKAVEQLGSKTLDVRIGGIYALERVARDPQRPPGRDGRADRVHPRALMGAVAVPRTEKGERRPCGIHATRHPGGLQGSRAPGFRARHRIHDLTRADLTRADLTYADLTDADLPGAYLAGADFLGTYLTGANLTGANLAGAHLDGAYFTDANLTGANLAVARGGAYLDGRTLPTQT